MRIGVRVFPAVAVIFALAVMAGCMSYSSSAPADRGQRTGNKDFHLWPLFRANATSYDKGVQDSGNILYMFHWSTWRYSPGQQPPKTTAPAPAAPERQSTAGPSINSTAAMNL